ncbi:MAG: hypothetical protein QM770_16120 [Tepidisphaeraceae bacterium]
MTTSTQTSPPITFRDLAAVCWGCAMALVVVGYNFGAGNHQVYLLPGVRALHPELLKNDWFTTGTLQYHFVFSWITSVLMRLNVLEAGFLIGHVLCVIGMNLAWWGIVRRLGAGVATYVLSVVFFYLSAAGLGPGVYSFLQDGEFLPSNIAAVLALACIYFWMARRPIVAGLCLGLAGLAHVNYAAMGIVAWFAVGIFHVWRENGSQLMAIDRRTLAHWAIATTLVVVPSVANIANALVQEAKQNESASLTLDQFVKIYVYLRHAHHHAPLTWPIALWLTFLWAVPIAIVALRKRDAQRLPFRQLGRVFALGLAMMAFAFVFAGMIYVSPTLVSLSFWRFDIFPKLIACVLTAWMIVEQVRMSVRRMQVALVAIAIVCGAVGVVSFASSDSVALRFVHDQIGLVLGLSALLAIGALMLTHRVASLVAALAAISLPVSIVLASRGVVGIHELLEADAEMDAIADVARTQTPVDAVFLLPPQDAGFRMRALRAGVVSFKHVPQLQAELLEWKRRLDRVLDMDTLALPRPMYATFQAIADRYESLPAEHLFAVAREFHADYVIAMRDLGPIYEADRVARSPHGRYVLYRVPAPATRPTITP